MAGEMRATRAKVLKRAALGVAAVWSAPTIASAGDAPDALVFPSCLVDQYGNVYNFTIDKPHKFVYGTVTNNQGCASTWPLVGSYTGKGGLHLELTAANPDDSVCIGVYKLKGDYPNAEWYYAFGPGGQAFQFTACSDTKPVQSSTRGGSRGPR
jgi:hypothetical protein